MLSPCTVRGMETLTIVSDFMGWLDVLKIAVVCVFVGGGINIARGK